MKRHLLIFCCLLTLSGELLAAAERRVALVIGNNTYQNLPKLEKAVNDANSVAAELRKVGFEVQAFNNVGQKKMNQAINEFVQNVSGGGVGVFFYAGHGVQIDNQNYLIPVDMDPPRDPSDVGDQAVSVPRLQDKLADAKAKYTLLVLDACHSGSATRGVTGIAPSLKAVGVHVMASCAEKELSHPDQDSKHGIFTKYLLEGMAGTADGNGDGSITQKELFEYVQNKMTEWGLKTGKTQRPQMISPTPDDMIISKVPGH
jgi:uncharacterized caspase-like protein